MKHLTHPQPHASEILIVQMHILQRFKMMTFVLNNNVVNLFHQIKLNALTNLFEREVSKQAIKNSIITVQQQAQPQQQNNQNLTLVWTY